MSYSHYIRCPECHKLSVTENQTPIELLMEGLANLSIQCPHCGFHKEYLEIPADEFESLSVSDDVAAEELKQ